MGLVGVLSGLSLGRRRELVRGLKIPQIKIPPQHYYTPSVLFLALSRIHHSLR